MLEIYATMSFNEKLFYMWLAVFTMLVIKDIIFTSYNRGFKGLIRHMLWPIVQPLRLVFRGL